MHYTTEVLSDHAVAITANNMNLGILQVHDTLSKTAQEVGAALTEFFNTGHTNLGININFYSADGFGIQLRQKNTDGNSVPVASLHFNQACDTKDFKEIINKGLSGFIRAVQKL